ncbi:MAG: glycosyltransferase [Alphaproteobacteria bacterium]|nr:glycosyltransferase [Alphaproteobacteria bacterium]
MNAMLRINILTRGFETPNGRAFLFPLVVHRRALAKAGMDIKFISAPGGDGVTDCDLLFVESRVFSSRWVAEGDPKVLTDIAALAEQAPIVWFDISDSTGWLQVQVLPLVQLYCKSQLLADRTEYARAHYGNRIWADFYHRTQGVNDNDPAKARIIEDTALLDKLRVSWNSGLADYSLHGPTRMALRARIPLDSLLRFPRTFSAPDSDRSIEFTCRMGTEYTRNSVAHQRRRIADLLADRMTIDKLGRRAFMNEMRNSRLVVSPFGFGEITLKDFEATLCGAALLKPDMSHLETWPNLFRTGETIVTHKWDLSDILDRIAEALDHADELVEIAQRAQDVYRAALSGPESANGFVSQLRRIVDGALKPSTAA